jgi:hypothetical protein
MYRVLRDYPRTERTGEVTVTPDGTTRWHAVTDWPVLGTAKDMAEAKAKFGGYPVLEQIR